MSHKLTLCFTVTLALLTLTKRRRRHSATTALRPLPKIAFPLFFILFAGTASAQQFSLTVAGQETGLLAIQLR